MSIDFVGWYDFRSEEVCRPNHNCFIEIKHLIAVGCFFSRFSAIYFTFISSFLQVLFLFHYYHYQIVPKTAKYRRNKRLVSYPAAFRSPYFGFIFWAKSVHRSPTAFIFFKIPLKNDNYPGLNCLIISIYPCTIGTIYPQNTPFFMSYTSCTKRHYHFWYICISF